MSTLQDDFEPSPNDIAVIGMSGRFPMAENVEQFWANLVGGKDCITWFDREQLLRWGADPRNVDHPNFVPAAGFIPDQEMFDAQFFDYIPRDVEMLDPQHRLSLEVAWEAFENAGHDVAKLKNVGVFAGTFVSFYLLAHILPNREKLGITDLMQLLMGAEPNFFSTRIAYKLNLKGPAVNVITTCSTSLVAIHTACQSLLNGECDVTLAGGAQIAPPSMMGYIYQEGGYASPDGRCRPFNAAAKGTVHGNGIGFVVLKRLEDALADGDSVVAVIKGSAINNDGSDKVGFTAPSISGQSRVIAEALSIAGIDAASMRYIEAHGTGTDLGDPIEVHALSKAYRRHTDATGYCAIGSLKSNTGHMGSAAGVAGLIKAALVLKHRVIPPTLHFEAPNPKLEIESSPFYVAHALEPLPASDTPLRAGVSSLGIGGTNAHILLEEPPAQTSGPSRRWQLLPLSARSRDAASQMGERLQAHLAAHPEQALGDVAYTLQLGRRHFEHRRFYVVPNTGEAFDLQAAPGSPGAVVAGVGRQSSGPRKVVFMFPGGGAQYVNMGRDLYASEPVYREWVDRIAERVLALDGHDLRRFLDADANDAEIEAALARPRAFFVTLFAVEYALAKLWMHWGIQPSALIGHSLGEYTAACLSGVLSLDGVLDIIITRGRLFDTLGGGAMVSVALPEATVRPLLLPGTAIAVINDPNRCVVAGTKAAMDAFEEKLKPTGCDYRRLMLDAAGHCSLVDPILDDFRRCVQGVQFGSMQIPCISNTSGTWMSAAEAADPEYWVRHLRQTVRFADGVRTLLADDNVLLLEVGPGNTLTSSARTQLEGKRGQLAVNSLRHPKEVRDDLAQLLEALGKLWAAGAEPDWANFYADEQRLRVPLPTYAFQRKRYWLDADRNWFHAGISYVGKRPVEEWLWTPTWRCESFQRSGPTAVKNLLVFHDERSLSLRWLGHVEAEKVNVCHVFAGSEFKRLDHNRYQIDPTRREDYEELCRSLQGKGFVPDRVAHLLTIDPMGNHRDGSDFAYRSLLKLVKALPLVFGAAPIDIVVVTSSLELVTDGDVVEPSQALLYGVARVAPVEHPQLKFRIVDVDATSLAERGSLARLLNAELLGDAPDMVVAYRSQLRFIKDFRRVHISPARARKKRIKAGGVYLVTGGAGGMGLALAQGLAGEGTQIVLAQRSELPERGQWDALLAEPDTDPRLKDAIVGIRAIEAKGALVWTRQLDVADRRAVEELRYWMRGEFGRVDGIVHCAGIGDYRTLADTDSAQAERTFAPKVEGTKNLFCVFVDRDLDFLVLCSSLAAVTTGYGLADYVAANAYLDAFARAYSDDNTFIVAVDWDNWEGRGTKGDRSAYGSAEEVAALLDPDRVITADEGRQVLQLALAGSEHQLVTSTANFAELCENNRRLFERQEDIAPLAAAEESAGSGHDRPDIATEYVAPETPEETLLVKIWQAVLGIERIGVNDNFFELGGESLLGVQVIARAKQAGLVIGPKQMFLTPTVRELARAAGKSAAAPAAPAAPVTGEVALSDIQRGFFARQLGNPHHWNAGLLFRLRAIFREDALFQVTSRLLAQHDMLRARFRQRDGQWTQHLGDVDAALSARYIDLSAPQPESFETRLQAACAMLNAEINLETGPLCILARIKGPTPEQRYLILIAHHLVVDGVSLQVLAQDLETLVHASVNNTGFVLPEKSASFQAYSQRLAGLAAGGTLNAAADYWLARAGQPLASLPVLRAEAPDLEGDAATCRRMLTAEASEALLRAVPARLGVSTGDILLAALASVLVRHGGAPLALVDVVGHGRNTWFDELDLSRTVGWLGNGHPVFIALPDNSFGPAAVQATAAACRAAPHGGAAYGVLRHLHPDPALRGALAEVPAAEVSFNYLGQFGGGSAEGVLEPIAEQLAATCDPANRRHHAHELVAFVRDDRLHLHWRYAGQRVAPAAVEGWLGEIADALQGLALNGDAAHADEKLQYGLTPLQRDIWRVDQARQETPRPPQNLIQTVLDVFLNADAATLQRAWQAVVDRHAALRTSLVDALDAPVQLVHAQATLPMQESDWSARTPAEQSAALDALLHADRLQGFDLHAAPLMRVHLLWTDKAQQRAKLLLTNHQIVTDGWSFGLILGDFLRCLRALSAHGALPPAAPPAFAQYVTWVNHESRALAEQYWQQRMQGFAPASVLAPLQRDAASPPAAPDVDYGTEFAYLDGSLSAALQQFARSQRVTLNTLFQAVWAQLLANGAGRPELVIGVTTSGRYAPIERMTEMVGQCTNALPLRVQVPARADGEWLRNVQLASSELQAHTAVAMGEIGALMGYGEVPFCESNLVFENLPTVDAGQPSGPEPLEILGADWTEGWHFPLRLFVIPASEIILRLGYDAQRLDPARVRALLDAIEPTLRQWLAQDNA